MNRSRRTMGILATSVAFVSLWSAYAFGDRISDIRNTRHNFSASVIPLLPDDGVRNAAASSESQVCAFCHTPHGASKAAKAPLWNRSLSAATYVPYSSGSIDAIDLDQPRAKSKLCLSCHDGTLALGAVNVLNGQQQPNIDITGPGVGRGDTIPVGMGAGTGFTRRLGTDLTNDHPISFTYDSAQASRDGELYDPALEKHVGERVRGVRPAPDLPLEENRVECVTCHDPHIRDTSGENIKFLRANRLQKSPPVQGQFDANRDIICLGCHDKEGWATSAHANNAVADKTFQDGAAALRDFPQGIQVWQAACLNCHDPHTVQGSRRLLREGTDGPMGITANGARFKSGGDPAIEETCYTCHSADGNVLRNQGTAGFEVPDIKTDFTTLRIHMPISSRDQAAGREVHDIGSDKTPGGGKDFLEAQRNLGKGDLTNRHVECTDCHNPHRMTRNRLFWADASIPDTEGTHNHTDSQIASNPEGIHTNIASGVLRGTFGVEPVAWASTEFMSNPVAFDVKRGDPGVGGSTDVNAPYVTREYQICLKCHSNYAYDTAPDLGSFSGGTLPGTNAMYQYTNQAMEYQSPDDHKGEYIGDNVDIGTDIPTKPATPSGAFAGIDPAGNTVDYQSGNHRAWHPVIKSTGRDTGTRTISQPEMMWRSPFNSAAALGVQTMYCTDCHGSGTDVADGVVPKGGEQGSPWGPHGSDNNFLLKGTWNDNTGENEPDGLCFRCHNFDQYANSGNLSPKDSGFKRKDGQTGCIGDPNNLHIGHVKLVINFRCSYCHVAVPHGWKNKNFLVNLNDVGVEAGLPPGTQVRTPNPRRYYMGAYYNGAVLKVRNFQRSGQWMPENCGSAGDPGNGQNGVGWMHGEGGETCTNIP